MTNHTQKLELTWIGKDRQPNLEPRILIEDAGKSYGDRKAENMLIHGDNLQYTCAEIWTHEGIVTSLER